MSTLRVGVVGATGVAGRQALAALAEHPWFELTCLAAGGRSRGLRLEQTLERDAAAWKNSVLPEPDPGSDTRPQALAARLPAEWMKRELIGVEQLPLHELDLVFSMLPTAAAREIEPQLGEQLPVISTAAAFRMEADTPLLLPGVNPSHFARLEEQSRARAWRGFVAPTPNCTTVGLATALAPLHALSPVRRVLVTSMQALSGAGGAAPALTERALGNVLPWIEGEEEKVGAEFRKILGVLDAGSFRELVCGVAATCTRVAVSDGHLLSVSVGFEQALSVEEAVAALRAHDPWLGRRLPSCPASWIVVRDEPDRPQPRLDLEQGAGLSTVVGRVRENPVLDGLSMIVLSHNAVLGAAGGAVLLAEDMLDQGLIARRTR